MHLNANAMFAFDKFIECKVSSKQKKKKAIHKFVNVILEHTLYSLP